MRRAALPLGMFALLVLCTSVYFATGRSISFHDDEAPTTRVVATRAMAAPPPSTAVPAAPARPGPETRADRPPPNMAPTAAGRPPDAPPDPPAAAPIAARPPNTFGPPAVQHSNGAAPVAVKNANPAAAPPTPPREQPAPVAITTVISSNATRREGESPPAAPALIGAESTEITRPASESDSFSERELYAFDDFIIASRGQPWTEELARTWLARLESAAAADPASWAATAAHREAAHLCAVLNDAAGQRFHLEAAADNTGGLSTERMFALHSLARLHAYRLRDYRGALAALDRYEALAATLSPDDLGAEWQLEAQRLIFDRSNHLHAALQQGVDPAEIKAETGVLPSELKEQIADMPAERRAALSLGGPTSDYLIAAATCAVSERNPERAAALYRRAIDAPDRPAERSPATWLWNESADALHPDRRGLPYIRELEAGERLLPPDAWSPRLSYNIARAYLAIGQGGPAAERFTILLESDEPATVAWRERWPKIVPQLLYDLAWAYGQSDILDHDRQEGYEDRLISQYPSDPLATRVFESRRRASP